MGMAAIQRAVNFLSGAIIVFGGVQTVFGIVVMASGLSDHNGEDFKQGVLRAVGGGILVGICTFLKTATFTTG